MNAIGGTTSLIDEVDKKLIVVLRDGRKFIGIMRSFDQFANIVLESTIERIYVGNTYGDVPLGIFIVRGENVVLLGDIDEERDAPTNLTKVSAEEIKKAQKKEQEAKELATKVKRKLLLDRGLFLDATLEDLP
eukprot:TRINITY_DN605_c0_g2_i1.p1 TRINITY_DN605_c0_g2~~TRINITY_DN605_c0_g2_i1.p1  ORF type:complete len:133 (+),score=34.01 TRINITY_DN605_c0_g2_i1:126-524(+)